LERVADALRVQMVAVDTVVPYARGELVARAKASGHVDESFTESGIRLAGHLPPAMATEVQNAGVRAAPRSHSA
jgi:GTP-binding protein HflX